MAFYTSKPVEIEAVRYDGNLDRIRGPFPDVKIRRYADNETRAEVYDVLHDTWVQVRIGDYIIRGTKGEYYPCDPDVFADKYELVLQNTERKRSVTSENAVRRHLGLPELEDTESGSVE